MKKNNSQKTILVLVFVYLATFAFGQDKTLTGKITTFDSIPLVGVNIHVKSTGQNVSSDSLGRFQVFCETKDKLKINADGFFPQKVKIEKEIRLVLINLNLKKGGNNMDMAEQYVQVGYGHVSARELMYAVSSVNKNEFDFTMYNDMFDLIAGQFPGVMVENGGIVVRGNTTFYGAQGNAALIVIDGAVTGYQDFANLSTFDVQSIDVLKDGSSSVYGSRGANGVVIVQTKKGK
jgi:TonB-dependent SusC/RagA subfamily outer membrane receptor